MTSKTIWIDIENPPQVQYLAPFVSAFERLGQQVVVTARDTGITRDLLRSRGIPHVSFGTAPPASRPRKVMAVLRRAQALWREASKYDPSAVLCASRAAAIVAKRADIPCFAVCDYEYVELGIFRRAGAFVLHPEVVPAESFHALGFSPDRLIGFQGLKEDLSFAGIDIDAVPAHDFGPGADGRRRVLVRPPAETSHYFVPRSRQVVIALLDRLARADEVLTIFSPRHDSQIADVETRTWTLPPVVLRRGLPFVSLLKAVDCVVSAGGTMLREAAYLGVPSFSLFAGKIGAVDDYLRRSGRLTVIHSVDDVDLVTSPIAKPGPMPRNPNLVDELVNVVLDRAAAARP